MVSPKPEQPSPEKVVAARVNKLGFALYPWLSAELNKVTSPVGLYCILRLLHQGAGAETRESLAGLLGQGSASRDPPDPRPLLDELESFTALTDSEVRGLREAAELRRQLEEGGEWDESFSGRLGMSSADDLRVHLQVANGIWLQKGQAYNPNFLEATRAMMPVDAESLDFEAGAASACESINAWVREQTSGRIESAIAPGTLPPLPGAIAGNAIYFKARWKQGFLTSRPGQFHMPDGSRVQVRSVIGVFNKLNCLERRGFRAVELPYSRRPISLVLIVPTGHEDDALGYLEGTLEERWAEIVDAGDHPRDVVLTMPEFTVRGGFRIVEALRELGLAGIAEDANYSGIGVEQGFRVDEVLHWAFLSANQFGTEVVTGPEPPVVGPGSGSEPVVLTIDRPFLFGVIDKVSGALLFLGRIQQPT